MKFCKVWLGYVAAIACLSSGCIPITSSVEARDASGVSSVEFNGGPFSSTIRSSHTPFSDWEICMQRLRGFDGAKAKCDAEMARWTPWQPSQWGRGYGGYPSYYAGYPYALPGTQIPYGP